jgi:hypothetical protein
LISSTRLKAEEQAGPVKSACCLQPDDSQAARQAAGSGSVVQLPTAARPWCWKALMGIRMADTARGYTIGAMVATL